LSQLVSAAPGAHEPSPQRRLLSEEATQVVEAALAGLPLRYRAPLVLREIEGLSYREIAVALGCREGTVKSRINRARERLKTLLEPYWRGAS
ncbi:MAG TPA: sigma-70 family RNA polymerase sigma factor, partial [Thermoanaerobaculia bacterium]|nr:sigma-70 family RNA polymerase sigma factor [Thermoanaerobaculia bacterium]